MLVVPHLSKLDVDERFGVVVPNLVDVLGDVAGGDPGPVASGLGVAPMADGFREAGRAPVDIALVGGNVKAHLSERKRSRPHRSGLGCVTEGLAEGVVVPVAPDNGLDLHRPALVAGEVRIGPSGDEERG